MSKNATERELRVCDICGQIDTAPRHRVAFAPNDAPTVGQAMILAVVESDHDADVKATAVAELTDSTIRSAHMDCCRDAGCPDGSCNRIHDSYDGPDKKDNALLKYIEGGAVDHIGDEINAERAELEGSDA